MESLIEQPSSFGIKKIVDCKIGEDGQQMYKVKWEPTWEPAENLATCQHLIDGFWSYINKAKAKEGIAQQHRKRMNLELLNSSNLMNINQNIDRLSYDSKEIQQLIARANATSVGSGMLQSPSNMLVSSLQNNQQHNLMGMATTLETKIKGTPKVETDDAIKDRSSGESAGNAKISNSASLKYLENFSNPYVKVIIVCKLCNKEASKFPNNWKSHYLTHASSEEKPHQCPFCPAGFVSLTRLTQHKEKKHAGKFDCQSEYSVKGEAY